MTNIWEIKTLAIKEGDCPLTFGPIQVLIPGKWSPRKMHRGQEGTCGNIGRALFALFVCQ